MRTSPSTNGRGRERRLLATAVAVCLIVLAGGFVVAVGTATAATPGEAAASTDATATANATGGDEVVVRGGSLPDGVDADRVWERVQRLVGAEAPAPNVTVREAPPRRTTAFDDAFGLDEGSAYEGTNAVTFRASGDVVLYPGDGWDAAQAETVLAHEFVHVLQFERLPGRPTRLTSDGGQARRAILEGTAIHATEAYADRYGLDAELAASEFERSAYRQRHRTGGPGLRKSQAPYRFGYRYVEQRWAGPEDAVDLVGTAPATTHPIVYPHRATTADPGSLNVTLNASAAWDRRFGDRAGAMLSRTVIAAELTDGEAKSATRAWRDDALYELVSTEDPTRRGYAWAVRLDSRSAATQFEFAAERFARGQHAEDPNDHFRVERLDDDTVVVFAGDRTFVEEANATRTGDDGVRFAAPDA